MNTGAFNHITDNELLKKYRSDLNKEWLGILLQRYTLLLLGVCMKYLKNEEEAKDAVQQIFLKALNELEKYQVGAAEAAPGRSPPRPRPPDRRG